MKELLLIAALSAPALSFNAPMTTETTFNQADAAFFSMLRAMSPNGYVAMVAESALPSVLRNVPHGGFILIDGPYGRVLEYFRGRDFERLPMLWRDKHIYRRQVGRSA